MHWTKLVNDRIHQQVTFDDHGNGFSIETEKKRYWSSEAFAHRMFWDCPFDRIFGLLFL
jgi:hypothetical protein